MIRAYVNVVKKASKGLENIAAVILFLSAMLVIANVISRRVFNMPITGTLDLVLFFTTALIALSIAYCAVDGGHISISIFVDRLPKKVQKIINVIIGTISALFLVLVARQLVLYAISSHASGDVSLTLRWPHYPFIILLAVGFGVLALVVIGQVLSLFIKEGEQS
ncbi:TRAP transporter small permease [Halalkalibacter okhensis]|uniref:TRAP transporter small permease n=1 Tax=Halalkalibacter okhensis TaxID=333138 RepID=UPI00068AB392|nr:TRAP transporter small permease [Halalkalibacter okhensis]